MPAEKFYDSATSIEGDQSVPVVTIAWGHGSSEMSEPGPYVNGVLFDRSGINRMIQALKRSRDQVLGEHLEGAVIEIVEKCRSGESQSVIIPNEIRINGTPVLAPDTHPVVVHEISMNDGDLVQVTLTLFAKRVTIGAE